jgi:Domain of unknown function (DUF4442)
MRPSFLNTARRENYSSRRFRILMNWYPMYFGTGGKVLFWSGDWQEVHLRLRRNIWSYNYVGTIFGGSLFSAADPFYMLMWYHILGKSYIVWDKSAAIRFRRPGTGALYARLSIEDEAIVRIQKEVAEHGEVNYPCHIHWLDAAGVIHAEIDRVVYIAGKDFYKRKKSVQQAL